MKIIASDFDGTLTHGGKVSEEDRAAIRRWRAAGNLFGVSTGRGYPSIKAEMQHHDTEYDFLICNNGCVIFGNSGNKIYEKTADGALLPGLLALLAERGGHAVGFNRDLDRYTIVDSFLRRDGDNMQIPMDMLCEYKLFNQADAYFDTDEEATDITAFVNKNYAGKVEAHQNGRNINIVPSGVSKSSGLARFCDILGVPYDCAVTIGDDYNDEAMIRDFNGVAVKNARPFILEIARKVYSGISGLVEDNMY